MKRVIEPAADDVFRNDRLPRTAGHREPSRRHYLLGPGEPIPLPADPDREGGRIRANVEADPVEGLVTLSQVLGVRLCRGGQPRLRGQRTDPLLGPLGIDPGQDHSTDIAFDLRRGRDRVRPTTRP